MSVILKGMDMPQNCQNCMDANLNIAISLFGAMCPFCEKIFVADINIRKQRHPDCPLIELPPHGRLVDATFEENHYASMLLNPTPDVTEQDKHKAKIVIDALRMAKTIIEAEGSEE